MKLPSFSIIPFCSRNARGTVLILHAITLFALFVVVALAIESSWLFLSRQRLQRATDAAALGAVRFIRDESAGTVKQIAQSIFEDNLHLMQLPRDSASLSIELRPTEANATDLALTALLPVAPIFMRLPNTQRFNNVRVSATGHFDRVIIGLVLDISGSMWARADSTCLPNPKTKDDKEGWEICRHNDNGPPFALRIDRLIEGVDVLLASLDQSRDYVAISMFSSPNDIDIAFHPNGGFNRTEIMDKLKAVVPGGGTPLGRGLRRMHALFDALPEQIKGTRSAIIVSDGAPSIGRSDIDSQFKYCHASELPSSLLETNGKIRYELSSCYLDAIAASDEFRRSGIRLDGIGFAREELFSPDPSDPDFLYQFGYLYPDRRDLVDPIAPFQHMYNVDNVHYRIVNDDAIYQDDYPQYQAIPDGDKTDLINCDLPNVHSADGWLQGQRRGSYLRSFTGDDIATYLLGLVKSTPPILIE